MVAPIVLCGLVRSRTSRLVRVALTLVVCLLVAGDARWLAGLALGETQIAGIALGQRRVVRGGLAGVEEVVMAQARKAALWLETGAAAVDMDSHSAAAYAALRPGDSARQTLRVVLPWPAPGPHAPLYVWLRGENQGRKTAVAY